jgi:hypothetical protein
VRAATNSFAPSFHLIDHKVQTDDSIEIVVMQLATVTPPTYHHGP